MAGESLAKLMTTRIIAMPHFHNYPTVKAFHIKMSRLYKMLLLWFPGNRPLRCDSLGNFVVNFHCYYQFSGGSTFLLKCSGQESDMARFSVFSKDHSSCQGTR